MDYTFFNIACYLSVAIFLGGMGYKLYGWATREIGVQAKGHSPGARIGAMFSTIFGAPFGKKSPRFFLTALLDVLLLRRSFKAGYMRWLAHMCIFYGFMLLLILHALEQYFVAPFNEPYASTLSPWMFLRDFFGGLVIFGLLIAMGRRIAAGSKRAPSTGMDAIILVLLAVIMISGFWLKGTKIGSEPRFLEMCEEYVGDREGEEVDALKELWSGEFGVVFKDFEPSGDPEVRNAAWEAQKNYCIECHSVPKEAFISSVFAGFFRPMQENFNNARFDLVLWHIHWLACFAALAWLPFSKFVHIMLAPSSLLLNGISDEDETGPELANRRALQLDACTHCGACSEHCSVSASFELMKNITILPSEKLAASKSMLELKGLSDKELFTLCEGSYVCTSCNRCSEICTSGINLQDLWAAFKEELMERGYAEPYIQAREMAIGKGLIQKDDILMPEAKPQSGLSYQPSFDTRYCFDCLTCTNICPVVANYEDAQAVLGLLPHQIIHSLRLGLKDMAMSSAMTWDCVTCYACQEACPQQVPLADVLYELRNQGFEDYKKQMA